MSPDTSNDERRAALQVRPSANEPGALVTQLLTAVRELTVVPVPGADERARGESALFFPVVGLALGGVLVGVHMLLPDGLSPVVRATLLVGLLIGLTGGRHLLGFARTTTAPGCASDGRVGARGVVAVVLLVLAYIILLTELDGDAMVASLLFAPMLSRWSMVAFAFGSRAVRGAPAAALALRAMKFREFARASVLALGVTLSYTEAWGLVVILVLAPVAIGSRVAAHGLWGGVTRPLVDTVGVCNEALALAVFWLGAA